MPFIVCLIAENPYISSNPTNVTVNAKGKATFSCNYERRRLPLPNDISWQINYSSGEVRINYTQLPTDDRAPQFTIQPVQPSDAGTYRCIITNEFSDAVSTPATLTVHCKHHFRENNELWFWDFYH